MGSSTKQLATRVASLVSAKRKTFYTIILAIKFYCGGKQEYLSCRISFTMKKKNTGKKLWKKPNIKKNNFFLKMCYFVNVSWKEISLQFTLKLICSTTCSIMLCCHFWDMISWSGNGKWPLFGRNCLFSTGNVFGITVQWKLVLYRNQSIDLKISICTWVFTQMYC